MILYETHDTTEYGVFNKAKRFAVRAFFALKFRVLLRIVKKASIFVLKKNRHNIDNFKENCAVFLKNSLESNENNFSVLKLKKLPK